MCSAAAALEALVLDLAPAPAWVQYVCGTAQGLLLQALAPLLLQHAARGGGLTPAVRRLLQARLGCWVGLGWRALMLLRR